MVVCKYNLLLEIDPRLQLERSVEDVRQLLRQIQDAQMLILDAENDFQEHLYWLLLNGTIHTYTLARRMMRFGYAKLVHHFLTFSILTMESLINLCTLRHLSWRVKLYTTVCTCFGLMAADEQNKAELTPTEGEETKTDLSANKALRRAYAAASRGLLQVQDLLAMEESHPVPIAPAARTLFNRCEARMRLLKLAYRVRLEPDKVAAVLDTVQDPARRLDVLVEVLSGGGWKSFQIAKEGVKLAYSTVVQALESELKALTLTELPGRSVVAILVIAVRHSHSALLASIAKELSSLQLTAVESLQAHLCCALGEYLFALNPPEPEIDPEVEGKAEAKEDDSSSTRSSRRKRKKKVATPESKLTVLANLLVAAVNNENLVHGCADLVSHLVHVLWKHTAGTWQPRIEVPAIPQSAEAVVALQAALRAIVVASRRICLDDPLLRAAAAMQLSRILLFRDDFRGCVQETTATLNDLEEIFADLASFELHRPTTGDESDALSQLSYSTHFPPTMATEVVGPRGERWCRASVKGEGIYGCASATFPLRRMLGSCYLELLALMFQAEIASDLDLSREVASHRQMLRRVKARKKFKGSKTSAKQQTADPDVQVKTINNMSTLRTIEAQLLRLCGSNDAWKAMLFLSLAASAASLPDKEGYFERCVQALNKASEAEDQLISLLNAASLEHNGVPVVVSPQEQADVQVVTSVDGTQLRMKLIKTAVSGVRDTLLARVVVLVGGGVQLQTFEISSDSRQYDWSDLQVLEGDGAVLHMRDLPDTSVASAEFKKMFKERTYQEWDFRATFVPQPGRFAYAADANESVLPPVPLVLSRTTTTMTLKLLAPPSPIVGGGFKQYRLFGKTYGAGTDVSLSNVHQPGLGQPLPASGILTVRDLVPNESYVFAAACFNSQTGEVIGKIIGPTCSPVVAMVPVPLRECWGRLLVMATVGARGCTIEATQYSARFTKAAGTRLFNWFVEAEPKAQNKSGATFDTNMQPHLNPASRYRLRRELAKQASTPQLRFLVLSVFALAETNPSAGKLADTRMQTSSPSRDCSSWVTVREWQLDLLENLGKLLVAIDVCCLIGDPELLMEVRREAGVYPRRGVMCTCLG